ncbi:hypothetical protein [Halomarina litorea]|uniref:hypothetical protein n=1 Tax=Halomarina litorea TaxID=2961595 RepID=UPI0020C2ED73|nr:hypothetical protein [Halomarina sp. BCD28]
MMWQDAVFLAGSVFSLAVLVPTLRDSMASVPLGTTLPSATIGVVYGATFLSLGMPFSAVGSLLTGVMWSLIAFLRSPHRFNDRSGEQSVEHSAEQSSHAVGAD